MPQRTRRQKVQLTERLTDELRGANVLYLTDFTGLNVQRMTELRRRFREIGTRYIVVKNRLALRALEGLDLPDISEYFRGPTGVVIGDDDPVRPAKTLREFARDHDDRPSVKVGLIERRIVGAEEVRALADLPPHEVLLGSIAGSLTAPVAGIVGALNAILADIAYGIEAVAAKRSNGD